MSDTFEDDVLGGDTMFIGNYHSSALTGGSNKSCRLDTDNQYSIGDIFIYTGDAFRNSKYLLCQISKRKVALIHLEYAKFWKSAVKVKDVNFITSEEFMKIAGSTFNNFYLLLGETVK